MKHVTLFENWTSSVTDDVTVNYDDQKIEPPKFSEIVEYTKEYPITS